MIDIKLMRNSNSRAELGYQAKKIRRTAENLEKRQKKKFSPICEKKRT